MTLKELELAIEQFTKENAEAFQSVGVLQGQLQERISQLESSRLNQIRRLAQLESRIHELEGRR